MRENKTCPYQGWKQLPTEELDKILQAELEKDHPSQEVILPILQELEEREKDYSLEKTPENLALLEQLTEHNTSPKRSKHRRGWIAGIAAIAAVACIVIMAIPRTVGAESIFDVLFRWTSSVFEFVDPEESENQPQLDDEFVTDNPDLQQLYDTLAELGVVENVVPMWLPEGYSLLEIKEKELRPSGTKVDATFIKDDSFITISYRISTNIDTKYEKEEDSVEIFEYSETQHFIIDNEGYVSVTWFVNGAECLLNANIPKNEILNMIKSIYGRNYQ